VRSTLLLAVLFSAWGGASAQDLMSAADAGALVSPPPDHRIAYGPDALQFGNLRLPEGAGPHPVVALIHGGCWLSAYDIGYIGALAQAIADAGYAVWSVEYRRVGDPGGGWPGTYRDVGQALDHLRVIAPDHALDLERVVVAGHSAGGALALWAAARPKLPEASDLHVPDPLPVRAVLGLAPAADLEAIEMRDSCGDVMNQLMGGSQVEQPARYQSASPMQLAPIGVPQTLVLGDHDSAWTPTGRSYVHRAIAVGEDHLRVVVLPDSGHFEMIAPTSSSWPLVRAALAETFEEWAPPAGGPSSSRWRRGGWPPSLVTAH
jgi:acetyl esterase/lipase